MAGEFWNSFILATHYVQGLTGRVFDLGSAMDQVFDKIFQDKSGTGMGMGIGIIYWNKKVLLGIEILDRVFPLISFMSYVDRVPYWKIQTYCLQWARGEYFHWEKYTPLQWTRCDYFFLEKYKPLHWAGLSDRKRQTSAVFRPPYLEPDHDAQKKFSDLFSRLST